MLTSMASLHPAWLTRAQVGTLSKVKHTGGTFGDYLSALRTAGAVEERGSGKSGELRITEHGFELLGSEAPAPATTDELLAMWRDRLKRGARSMLDALVDSHPQWLAREDLAEAAGIAVTGGTFGDYLSMLRRTGLIEEDGRLVRAAETLFLGAT
jgi:predicted transcriptional regulator